MSADIERIGPYLQVRAAPVKSGSRTLRWTVYSGNVPDGEVGEELVTIAWYAPWRRYCVEVEKPIVLDPACLTALADFCARKTKAHRIARNLALDILEGKVRVPAVPVEHLHDGISNVALEQRCTPRWLRHEECEHGVPPPEELRR